MYRLYTMTPWGDWVYEGYYDRASEAISAARELESKGYLVRIDDNFD